MNLGNSSSLWSDTGTINTTNTTVNLGGSFTAAGLGTFNRTGGVVNLDRKKLDASAQRIGVECCHGLVEYRRRHAPRAERSRPWRVPDCAVYQFPAERWTGVTANANLDLATNNAARVTITDGLVLNATALLGNNVAIFTWQHRLPTAACPSHSLTAGAQTLSGTGTVQFGTGYYGYNDQMNVSSGTLTIGSGITIQANSGYLEGNTIINQGTISDTAPNINGALQIDPSSFTNQGTVQVSGGGILSLAAGFANAGAVTVQAGSAITSNSVYAQSSGTTNMSGGTLSASGWHQSARWCIGRRGHDQR